MGRGLPLIALAATAALVPAAPAQGPAGGAAPPPAPLPLPRPGPMADQRDALGAGPRGDARLAARRSPSGRRIRVHFHGSGTARSRVLVVGCLNGLRCAGERVPVRYECPPDDAEFWWIRSLRPEGADLDRSPQHPGAAVLRQAVADLRPQLTVLYRTGPRAVVRAWGAGDAAGRRYARTTGLPFSAAPGAGLAGWIQTVRRGSRAIVVELPPGRIGWLDAQRHAFAIQRLAGTRFRTPVRAASTPGGAVSALAGPGWRAGESSADRLGTGLMLGDAVRRPGALPCRPGAVRRALGRYGTLVLVHDEDVTRQGALVHPPRPPRLRLGPLRWAPCVGPAHVLRFSEAGRNVEIVVAFGRDATRWTRDGARAVLDSVRVEA